MDYDSTRLKGSIEAIYEKANESKEAILVGTQMLSKGHDFPKVTLCVILNADGGLLSPEINAVEKISQQLIQVSGRAGRNNNCLLYTSPSPRDGLLSRMPSSA